MQQPSPAARRFYAAFYRWVVAASEPAGRRLRSRFHTTTRCHGEGASPFRIRKHALSSRKDAFAGEQHKSVTGSARRDTKDVSSPLAVPDHDNQKRPKDEVTDPSLLDVPKAFADSTVQSPIVKPFSTFKPQEFVVRYRSASSLMLEAAIPEAALLDLERRHGNGLRGIHGARIEVQKDVTNTADAEKSISVLLSGTFDEVSESWSRLWKYEAKVHVSGNVQSYTARPSDTLRPLESVTRPTRTSKFKIIELSVTEQQWMKFIAAHDLDTIAKETKAKIEVADSSMRPVDTASDRKELARSFVIKGKIISVLRAHDMIYLAIDPAATTSNSDQKASIDGEVQDINAAPKNKERILRHWFDIKSFDQPKIYNALTAGDGAKLRDIRHEAGCKTFTVDSPTQVFMARGTRAQLIEARNILQQQISHICAELGLALPEVATLHKPPSSQSKIAINPVDQPDDRLSDNIRTALRALTHPVVMITSKATRESSETDDKFLQCRGVTVSSFNTVTLDPKPVISFNLKVPSRSWDAMLASKRLRVHLLAATPGGAAIASVFTQPYEKAHDGFRRLAQMGAGILVTRSGTNPPRIVKYGDILGGIKCTLLPEQCVQVGDHVIVVAEAERCILEAGAGEEAETFVEETGGLSYARRSYQGGGASIKPSELPELGPEENLREEMLSAFQAKRDAENRTLDPDLDPLALGEPRQSRPIDIYRPLKDSANAEGFDRNHYGPIDPDNETVYGDLRTAGDARGLQSAIQNEPLSREVEDEEEDYDFGFQPSQQDDSIPPAKSSRNAGGPLWGPEDVTREESERLAENAAPRGPPSQVPTANSAGFGLRRPYSTFARRAFHGRLGLRRSFSSMLPLRSDSKGSPSQVDPSARNMTVADFFGIPDEGRPRYARSNGLVRAKSKIIHAERQLAWNADLPEEERLQYQHQIQIADRKISKKLAWNAAIDLRVMLDKGKVDFKRAQFLESAIEKGQATLIEDAKRVRELLNEAKIDLERFNVIKKQLEETSEILMTEAMRLRQVVDEEGDYFEDPAEEKGEEGFDGFEGNR